MHINFNVLRQRRPVPRGGRLAVLAFLSIAGGLALGAVIANVDGGERAHFLQSELHPRTSVKVSSRVRRTSVSSPSSTRQVRSRPALFGPASSGRAGFTALSRVLRPAAPEAPVLVSAIDGFPEFGFAVFPVSRVPDWGRMRTPAEWNRTYDELPESAFVPVPAYDRTVLTTPIHQLIDPITEQTIPMITAKLLYSTRHFGSYNLDADEYTADHPGIDLKLAEGTPIGAVGGGRVHQISSIGNLGLHVIIEHQVPGEGTLYSIYGHLGAVWVREGEAVAPGTVIGNVGMTGATTAPHLHLQIDRARGQQGKHVPYWPNGSPTREEANRYTVHPMWFIGMY